MGEIDTALYLLDKKFLMAELMKPKGKPFDIKKTSSKIQTLGASPCMMN